MEEGIKPEQWYLPFLAFPDMFIRVSIVVARMATRPGIELSILMKKLK
jgi:hypothetical protein